MAVFAAVAFAAFLLEDDNFVTFYERFFDLANNFGAINGGGTDFDFTIGVGEKHFVEFDSLAFFDVVAEVVNIQVLAGFSLELLSLNFYNCVHANVIKTK